MVELPANRFIPINPSEKLFHGKCIHSRFASSLYNCGFLAATNPRPIHEVRSHSPIKYSLLSSHSGLGAHYNNWRGFSFPFCGPVNGLRTRVNELICLSKWQSMQN